MGRIALQTGLRAHAGVRAAIFRSTVATVVYQNIRHSSHTPTIVQASFWKSLIPKPFRAEGRENRQGKKKLKSKEWNPATFFIWMFLFVGSMSIQMISLKKNFAAFVRQSDVRIGLLREVVEKLQKGEEVDVEKVLGAGIPEKEIAWEDVLREIEKDDISRQKKQEKSKQSSASPATTSVESKTKANADISPQNKTTVNYSGFF